MTAAYNKTPRTSRGSIVATAKQKEIMRIIKHGLFVDGVRFSISASEIRELVSYEKPSIQAIYYSLKFLRRKGWIQDVSEVRDGKRLVVYELTGEYELNYGAGEIEQVEQ